MELTWHGHSCWRVTVGDTDLLIDPFFANPQTSLDAEEVEQPDYVLLTHGHADHLSDADQFSDTVVVGTPAVTGYAEANLDFDDSIAMNLGGTLECGDAYVTMHRADHTNALMSEYGQDAGMPAGYVISDTVPTQVSDAESTTFYHAGDTALMTEMRDVIGPHLEPDAAALPVGDHYTMGPWQAALAVDWLGVDHAFPMHYDTFPQIEIDPQEFVREVAATGSSADVHVLEAESPFELSEDR